MGELRKICRSTLLQEIKGVDPEKQINDETTTALDGIALVRKIKTSRKTFGEMSDILLQTVLNHGGNSRRIDIVFGVYRDHSIQKCRENNKKIRNTIISKFKSDATNEAMESVSLFLTE